MKTQMKHNAITIMFALMAMVLMINCSGAPLPSDKTNYAGVWESEVMHLAITADGRVEYKRIDGGGTRSVSGPIRSYQGDDFEVGIPFISTVFKVNKTPYIAEGTGKWRMVVDGVELVKKEF